MSSKPKRVNIGQDENITQQLALRKKASPREEEMSSVLQGEWAVAKSQRDDVG